MILIISVPKLSLRCFNSTEVIKSFFLFNAGGRQDSFLTGIGIVATIIYNTSMQLKKYSISKWDILAKKT